MGVNNLLYKTLKRNYDFVGGSAAYLDFNDIVEEGIYTTSGISQDRLENMPSGFNDSDEAVLIVIGISEFYGEHTLLQQILMENYNSKIFFRLKRNDWNEWFEISKIMVIIDLLSQIL